MASEKKRFATRHPAICRVYGYDITMEHGFLASRVKEDLLDSSIYRHVLFDNGVYAAPLPEHLRGNTKNRMFPRLHCGDHDNDCVVFEASFSLVAHGGD